MQRSVAVVPSEAPRPIIFSFVKPDVDPFAEPDDCRCNLMMMFCLR
jgi:hypothetical protein